MKKKCGRLILFLGLSLLLGSCRSKDGDLNIFSEEQDVEMGRQYAAEIRTDERNFPVLSKDLYPEAYAGVERIRDQILESDHLLHRDEFPWEVVILDNDTVLNAFCTPGGFIYVYTGLIRSLDSEDQLAGVLGHEIAHADLRHSTEQLTKSYGLGLVVKLIFGDHSVLGGLAGNLAGLSFSRKDEAEADKQSVLYLSDTPYDPRGVARFFEKMEKRGESMGPFVFLSTHPNPERRVEKIMDVWKELGSPVGKTYKERYQVLKESLD